MAIIAQQIKKQYFDVNGDPLNGGKLYTYEAGTTTPTDTYTDEGGLTANANPIILDSRGEVSSMFLVPGSYKWVLTDSADAVIWTQDNVTVRDLGSELDDLSASLTDLDDTVTETIQPNRLVSGEKSANSSQARFLEPVGSTNQVTVLATATDLVYFIEGVSYTLSADLVASGFVSPPVTNNTALVNDSTLADQNSTELLGEFGTSIPYDAAGSEITNLDGDLVAFKIAGAATEYFLARVDNANSRLIEARRGFFYDSSSNPIERTAFSDNDVITLMKLSYLYLTTTGSVLVSYTEPVYATTEPSSPLDGDMWFDITNAKWKRFNSTSYIDALALPIGFCIQDESGDTVGARADDFYAAYGDDNTFNLEYVDATSIRSKNPENIINVSGNERFFDNASVVWNIASDLEAGESEGASRYFNAYIKENGDKVISPIPPYDRMGDLKGYYHSYEAWRYVGRVFNDESQDFDELLVEDSPERPSTSDAATTQTKTDDYTATIEDDIIFIDAVSNDVDISLYPSAGNIGKKIILKRVDAAQIVEDTFIDGDVTIGTDNINIASHPFQDLQRIQLTTGGTLPSGLSPATDYYVIYVDSGNIKLANSRANAIADTAIDIDGAAGGGTHTITSEFNTVTIDADGSETIDDDLTDTLDVLEETVEYVNNGTGWERIRRSGWYNEFSASIANNGTATITSQGGDCIDSVERTAAGEVEMTWKLGFFSVAPTVQCNHFVDAASIRIVTVRTATTLVCKVRHQNTSNTGQDIPFHLTISREGADRKE
ncbi:MAG: hypothetical protein ACPG5Z_00205 [Pseudoalteromonas sp.]